MNLKWLDPGVDLNLASQWYLACIHQLLPAGWFS